MQFKTILYLLVLRVTLIPICGSEKLASRGSGTEKFSPSTILKKGKPKNSKDSDKSALSDLIYGSDLDQSKGSSSTTDDKPIKRVKHDTTSGGSGSLETKKPNTSGSKSGADDGDLLVKDADILKDLEEDDDLFKEIFDSEEPEPKKTNPHKSTSTSTKPPSSTHRKSKPIVKKHVAPEDSYEDSLDTFEPPTFDEKLDLDDEDLELGLKHSRTRRHKQDSHVTSKTRTLDVKPADFLNSSNPGLSASLRYLGSGYDIVFGNPLGDPIVMMDQGYRNPVVKLNWDIEYSNRDGANLKEPYGSWIRPEYSCRQSETIDHVNSIDDFKKELSVDAQASGSIPFFFSFTASTGYKNFVKSTATNKVRTYISKTYCLRYVAGMVNYNLMEPTNEFKAAVDVLPEKFDHALCTLDVFKANENDPLCASSVKPWIQFFKMFGTHFTTIVHLGGKITHQVQIKKSDVLHMQESGMNVDTAIKAVVSPTLLDSLGGSLNVSSDISSNKTDNSFRYDKQVIVIGGDTLVDSKDINSLHDWAKGLSTRPMPIKIRLESIRSLLKKEGHKTSFDEALKFYSETYGVTPDDIYKKYGKEFGIASLARRGHQVVYSGSRPGSAVCPNKTTVIMGFTLVINRDKKLVGKNKFPVQISACPIGEEKCIVSNDHPNSEYRIWIVCGTDPIPLLVQHTATSVGAPAMATCPMGFSIAYGFAFSIPKGNNVQPTDAYPCRATNQTCVHESEDPKATNSVWIACVENGAPQLSEITNHTVSTSSMGCSAKQNAVISQNVCPENSTLIGGWSMAFSESVTAVKTFNKCSRENFACTIDDNFMNDKTCKSFFSWIACSSSE